MYFSVKFVQLATEFFSVDKWDIWKEYVNSVFELMSDDQRLLNNHTNSHEHGENDLELVDDSPEKAHEFICRLVENGTDNGKNVQKGRKQKRHFDASVVGFLLRGPYLARFELCSKLLKRNVDTTDLLGDTTELFIEYFRKFGHKPCCVSDLKIYLNVLDCEKKSELSTRLMKDVGISDTSVPQSVSSLFLLFIQIKIVCLLCYKLMYNYR